MENSYIWSINGCEFEVDMEDAGTVERYVSAIKILENDVQVSDVLEKIRAYCKTYREFYDAFLGEGASEKIFAGKSDNSRKYDEVFESLLDFIDRQHIEVKNRKNRFAQRYTPKTR